LITRTRLQIRAMLLEAYESQMDNLIGKPVLTPFSHKFTDGRVLDFGKRIGTVCQKGHRLIQIKVTNDEGHDWQTSVYLHPQTLWYRKTDALDHICRGIDETWEYSL
jgi:hypothetical protein